MIAGYSMTRGVQGEGFQDSGANFTHGYSTRPDFRDSLLGRDWGDLSP